ncbi:MAG: hypothetical protein ACYC0V_17300 [Armatimonadota bacterium]
MQKHILLGTILATGILMVNQLEAKSLPLTFACQSDNDVYKVLSKSGYKVNRYDTLDAAIEKAPSGSGVLILADRYPDSQTEMTSALYDTASQKKLRFYVEYPSCVPGMKLGKSASTEWERTVVSADVFGSNLKKLRILALQDCHYIPVEVENPLLVVGRVAGYDTAVYGLPSKTSPLLFEILNANLLISTTKLSNFVTGRYAPKEAWKSIWEWIIKWADPNTETINLDWEPVVRPAYSASGNMPSDYERRAFDSAAEWFHKSRLLIPASRKEVVDTMLLSGGEMLPTPGLDEPVGDGTHGLLEGYASAIKWDGNQMQRAPLRNDCTAEAAMTLSLDWGINANKRSRDAATNLLDFIYFNSGMCKGGRGNPEHPAFGLVAWGDIAPVWLVANYGDDNARGILGTIISAACLDSRRWDESVMRSLLANLRTTGTLGFRTDRIDIPDLTRNGWKVYYDGSPVSYAPHFESYLWACYLWAYNQTKYEPFLDRTKTAIRMTMDAYPGQWRWGDSIERARMLLCLAWLVRVEDIPEHRGWLRRVADDLLTTQDTCGALQERINDSGGGGHYFAPQSNEAYGTGETPLIQQNGDPASDQLYTTGFALLGLHEAFAATGDLVYKKAEDMLMEFLCRIQVRSDTISYLDGAWFRAFDYKRWEYWASSGDLGWGAWSIESGWCNAWTGTVLGLRVKNTSVWDLTSGSQIERTFRDVKKDMARNDGSPWK